MGWPEVDQAADEHRYELVLSGPEISERIEKGGLDLKIFELSCLNFLQISNTKLFSLPEDLGNLLHLKTLDLHRNSLQELPSSIGLLKELKNLDLSGNELEVLPSALGQLSSLQTLNLNCNKLTEIPDLKEVTELSRLDLSHNQLTELPESLFELQHLAELQASNNNFTSLSSNVSKLSALKVLILNANKITSVPTELSLCHKLKELNLQENAIKDNRLAKLIKECRTKPVLDYVAAGSDKGKGGRKGGKKGRNKKTSDEDAGKLEEAIALPLGPVIRVLQSERLQVIVKPSVETVRPYIVCTVVKSLDLADMTTLKKFISIQTKLHDSLCEHRTLATVATHDLASLKFPLEYEGVSPSEVHLIPLGRHKEMTAEQLIKDLRTEALKQKQKLKKNPFKTGLYKYLSLVEDAQLYAVVRNSDKSVISFPPVTNSENSKIKAGKLDVLLEVTSSVNLPTCKSVMEQLIKSMLECGLSSCHETSTTLASGGGNEEDSDRPQELIIEQVRVVNHEGQLKVVYPSRVDLQLEAAKIVYEEKA
ncbi:leucine-rich repeat-containing protein 47-like [Acropora millepora]|uniref:leucine-rich repeat-containing protein 47-like n=1 Tax=Acropora millepora TaxID=45264 RepID=UPI001CF40AF4|nr:leucine-rich repeat-containing protein 47-like [Acropora millepora]